MGPGCPPQPSALALVMFKKDALSPAACACEMAAFTAARGRVGDMRPTVQKK